VWFVGPILWIALASTQPEDAITSAPPRLTANLDLHGYALLLTQATWRGSLLVSLQVAILATTITIVLASLVAYPLARFRLPGRGVVLGILIFTQMVPGIVLAIPILILFQNLQLKDTVIALVIVNVAFSMPLIVWLLRNVFEDVPLALEKAARIDGCSRLGTLFRVTIPAAAPGIAAAAILLLIGIWNEFLFAVILGDTNAVTITRRIGYLESYSFGSVLNQTPPFNLLATGGIVAVLPCLLLVLLFHRRIISGLTEGFVKG